MMLKFSFFAPRSKAKAQRSKSLDHLNGSRNHEWKKEGKLARLRRSLSFSERHGAGKAKEKVPVIPNGTGKNQHTNCQTCQQRVSPVNVYPIHSEDTNDTNLKQNFQPRRTYSCCELDNGNCSQFQLPPASQNRNRRSCHFPLATPPDYHPFSLSNGVPASIEATVDDTRISRVEVNCQSSQITERQEESVLTKTTALISPEQTNKYNHETRNEQPTTRDDLTFGPDNRHFGLNRNVDFLQHPFDRQKHPSSVLNIASPGVARSQTDLLHHSMVSCVPNSEINLMALSSRGRNQNPLSRSTSCSCVISGRRDPPSSFLPTLEESRETGDQSNKPKRYIIVKRHYTSKQPPNDDLEKASASQSGKNSKDIMRRKHLFRAKSEGSLHHGHKGQKNHDADEQKPLRYRASSIDPKAQLYALGNEEMMLSRELQLLRQIRLGESQNGHRGMGSGFMETSIDDYLLQRKHEDHGSSVNGGRIEMNEHHNHKYTRLSPFCSAGQTNEKNEFVNKLTNGVSESIQNIQNHSENKSQKRTSNTYVKDQQQKKLDGLLERGRQWKKKKRSSVPSVEKCLPNQEGPDEKTLPLLHIAAKEGDTMLMKTLIDIGVDINEEDEDGWPALHHAVQAGQFEAAGLLIKHGGCLSGYTDKVVHEYCTSVRTLLLKRQTQSSF